MKRKKKKKTLFGCVDIIYTITVPLEQLSQNRTKTHKTERKLQTKQDETLKNLTQNKY